jgi:hypothetical protein
MNNNPQNTEYETLSVQSWEIEGIEDISENSFEANTQRDQQDDQSCEYSN